MKRLMSFLAVLMLVGCLAVPAMASDVRTGDAIGGGTTTHDSTATNGSSSNIVQDAVNQTIEELAPSVSVDDLITRLEDKGNDVVSILQTVGKYVCIGGFTVSVILFLIGCIGNKKLAAGGAIGMIVAGLAYTGIVCGRDIVNFIANWAAS